MAAAGTIRTNEKQLLAAAKIEAKRYPEIKFFEDVPGIGFISAARYPPFWKHRIVLPIEKSLDVCRIGINEEVLRGQNLFRKIEQRL